MEWSVFPGDYMTKRDGGRYYTYLARYPIVGRQLEWEADVRTVDGPAGKPAGMVTDAQHLSGERQVRDLVIDSIELRVGVR